MKRWVTRQSGSPSASRPRSWIRGARWPPRSTRVEASFESVLRGAGKPTVKLGKGKVTVTGLPERAAVAELTMYRLKKIEGAPKRNAFKLKARIAPSGTTLKVRTKRLR